MKFHYRTLSGRFYDYCQRMRIRFAPLYYSIVAVNVIIIAKNWAEILKWHFKKTKKECIVKLRSGEKLIISGPADISMLSEIWGLMLYNPKEIPIRNGSTIVDIGAHVGCFSQFASKLNSDGKIYCFEPFKENYDKLVRGISLSKKTNITPFNKAVAGHTGTHDFYPCNSHNGCHSLYERGEGSKITVETISLDDFFKETIDICNLLKLDCEGAEYEILYNASDETLNKINIIVGELHDDIVSKKEDYNEKGLKKFLISKGFNYTFHLGMFYAIRK